MGQKSKKRKTEKSNVKSDSLIYVKYCVMFVAAFCSFLFISQQLNAMQTPQVRVYFFILYKLMFLIYRENTAEMYEVKYFKEFSTKLTLLFVL